MTKTNTKIISLPRLSIQKIKIKIIGDTPLIVHAWSEKSKRELIDKQKKKAKNAKEARDFQKEFYDCLYWLTEKPKTPSFTVPKDAKFGFPANGVKACAVSSCRFIDGIKMTEVRGAFHINGEFIEIKGTPTPREDMVRIPSGADVRCRAEFKEWSAEFEIDYNTAALSEEEIFNLFHVGGFGVGLGDWRPEKDGTFGKFHIG